MRKMDTVEMMAVNAGGRCPYCRKNKSWYELWLHKALCGMMFNLTGGQRKNSR